MKTAPDAPGSLSHRYGRWGQQRWEPGFGPWDGSAYVPRRGTGPCRGARRGGQGRDHRRIIRGMKSIDGHARSLVRATPAQCFPLLAAVDRYPEWNGELVREVTVLERDETGRPSTARLSIHVAQSRSARTFSSSYRCTPTRNAPCGSPRAGRAVGPRRAGDPLAAGSRSRDTHRCVLPCRHVSRPRARSVVWGRRSDCGTPAGGRGANPRPASGAQVRTRLRRGESPGPPRERPVWGWPATGNRARARGGCRTGRTAPRSASVRARRRRPAHRSAGRPGCRSRHGRHGWSDAPRPALGGPVQRVRATAAEASCPHQAHAGESRRPMPGSQLPRAVRMRLVQPPPRVLLAERDQSLSEFRDKEQEAEKLGVRHVLCAGGQVGQPPNVRCAPRTPQAAVALADDLKGPAADRITLGGARSTMYGTGRLPAALAPATAPAPIRRLIVASV